MQSGKSQVTSAFGKGRGRQLELRQARCYVDDENLNLRISPEEPPPVVPIRPSKLAKWVGRVPELAIAVVLFLPILLLGHFEVLREIPWFRYDPREYWTVSVLSTVALFLPGAIRRWKWRHVVVMLAAGPLGYGLQWGLQQLMPAHYRWMLAVGVEATPILVLGLGEMVLSGRLSRRGVLWLVGGATAIAALVQLAGWWTWLAGWRVSLPDRYGTGNYAVSGLIMTPLTVLLVWSLIPLCNRISRAGPIRWRLALLGFFVLAYGATCLFMEFLSYPCAQRSMLNDGPFDREASVRWLVKRGTDVDFELIWKSVEQSKWTRSAWRRSEDEPSYSYWRGTAISALAWRDSAGTANRLSSLLRRNPSVYIAEDSAKLLAEHQKYEAVPLLMRYALAEDSWICSEALEKMNLAEAALPIIRHDVASEARFTGKQLERLEDHTRKRLARLLGRDAGPNVGDWLALYDQVAPDAPTPLSKSVRDETTRVIAAWLVYHQAADDWATNCFQQVRRQGLSGEAGMEEVRRLLATVAKPNWNVVTTADLSNEVEAYSSRISEAIDNSRTSQPTSQVTH